MQDLEPPEAPVELMPQVQLPQQTELPAAEPKKEGFFKRLFSKKNENPVDSINTQDNSGMDLPSMELPPALELPPLDDINGIVDNDKYLSKNKSGTDDNGLVLPLIDMHLEDLKSENSADLSSLSSESKSRKVKGKLKKGQKATISKIDESSQFDWSREVTEQDILIHDSNRYNQDVNVLIGEADRHVNDRTKVASGKKLLSTHKEVQPVLEPINIQELNIQPIDLSEVDSAMIAQSQMPSMDEMSRKEFANISLAHEKLRSKLEKSLSSAKLFNMNKTKAMDLFKSYDASIESVIEDKELSLTHKRKQLKEHENKLKGKEKDLREMQVYIKGLDKKLKDRETNINKIISDNVESELRRRMKAEKTLLSEELKKTVTLNKDLKKKVSIIESDRKRFEKENQHMSETERKKLNALQSIYEKKLTELDSDKKELETQRKAFEERRKTFDDKKKDAIKLLDRADFISKELSDVEKMKSYIDEKKTLLEKDIVEDTELRQAITKAEDALAREKANLDNMIFSKYIEKKLKSIKPEYLEKKQDWKAALHSNPLYERMGQCKKLLSQRDIEGAKTLYNNIRKEYDSLQVSRKEKEALYTAIRELYNDIQIRIVELQMHSRQ